MQSSTAVEYLLEAAEKAQQDIAADNPFRQIGFDGGKPRLGWARTVDFERVKTVLRQIDDVIYPFNEFIFVGMGGSGNGIKPLLSLYKDCSIHTVDSLDPAAYIELKNKIKDFNKTVVVVISKSGTTKESQMIAAGLRDFFGAAWIKHFLFLSDPSAQAKLDALGWTGVKRFSIQFDAAEDIGGRFSCPLTAIFFLPLFILYGKDYSRLESLYTDFLSMQRDIRQKAAELAEKNKNKAPAYFSPAVKDELRPVFASWLYQLFQESLGSKKEGLAVKTVVFKEKGLEEFVSLPLVATFKDPVLYVMAHMYFFQCFVAFYAAFQGLNFVNQDFVEKYKAQMRKLEGQAIEDAEALTLAQVTAKIKTAATAFKFIDVVLYFHPATAMVKRVKEAFTKAFPEKPVIVVEGSDWNHHSYQAVQGDRETFFVLLTAGFYPTRIAPVSEESLRKNIEALKVIAKATYLTMSEKSVLLALTD